MDDKRPMKMLTTGMHDFPRLIADNEKKYVDKTDLLYELVRDKTDAQLSGQTSMIVDRLKAADDIPADLEGMAVTRMQLDVCPAETMPLVALMYQGGFLTIKRARPSGKLDLGIPNEEVANSLAEGYVSSTRLSSARD